MDSALYKPGQRPEGSLEKRVTFHVSTYTANYDYPITTPSGRVVNPPAGSSCLANVSQEDLKRLVEDNRIWFGSQRQQCTSVKKFLNEVKQGVVAKTLTIWLHGEVGHNQEAKQEVAAI